MSTARQTFKYSDSGSSRSCLIESARLWLDSVKPTSTAKIGKVLSSSSSYVTIRSGAEAPEEGLMSAMKSKAGFESQRVLVSRFVMSDTTA